MQRLKRAVGEPEKRDHFETKTSYLCGLNELFLSNMALRKRYRRKCKWKVVSLQNDVLSR